MRIFIFSLGFIFTLAATSVPVRADTVYTDADSEYLKFTSFFVEPVGRLLEWVVFRPAHAVHHWTSPAELLDGRPARECTGLRPRRDCARN
jgi:hypothetical protein